MARVLLVILGLVIYRFLFELLAAWMLTIRRLKIASMLSISRLVIKKFTIG